MQKSAEKYPTFSLILDETRLFLSKLLRQDSISDLVDLRVFAFNVIETYI